MKRMLTMLLALCMLLGAASAQAEHVSVTELREQIEEMGRWTQTYEAHGRTIAVDVPVIVPEVERVPIVQVSAPLGIEVPERLGLPVVEANGRHFTYEDANLLSYLNENNTSGEAVTVWCMDPQSKDRADFSVYSQSPLLQPLGSTWWYTSEYY